MTSSKHRCKCYSEESSSFLYGLRREGPSTERVVLERLLNVLSRAAAKSSNNPQRLWSEEPDWWKECTKLKWKNPREHPKDKKDTLKKKIDILEKQLRQRGLMTPTIEKELELWKNSKKADLELKSDFEAVIAKASGLHYMVDQVFAKMDKTQVFSDKIAEYILELKGCLDKCTSRMDQMYARVDARQKRKEALWEHFGVSKTKRSRISEDELGSVDLDFLSDDVLSLLEPDPLDSRSRLTVVSPAALSEPSISPTESLVPSGLRRIRRSVSEPFPGADFSFEVSSMEIPLVSSPEVEDTTDSKYRLTVQVTSDTGNVLTRVKSTPSDVGPSPSTRDAPRSRRTSSHRHHRVRFVESFEEDVALETEFGLSDILSEPFSADSTLDIPSGGLPSESDYVQDETRRSRKHRRGRRPKTWSGSLLSTEMSVSSQPLFQELNPVFSAGAEGQSSVTRLTILPRSEGQGSRRKASEMRTPARTFTSADLESAVSSLPGSRQPSEPIVIDEGSDPTGVLGDNYEILEVTPVPSMEIRIPDTWTEREEDVYTSFTSDVDQLGSAMTRTLSFEDLQASVTHNVMGSLAESVGAAGQPTYSSASSSGTRGTQKQTEEQGSSSPESLSKAIGKFDVF